MKVRSFLIITLFTLTLTSCGLVATFIPPIDVGDALGLEGQTVSTTLGTTGGQLTTAAAQQVSGQRSLTRTFDDQDLDLRGFSVAEFHAKIGFHPDVIVTRPLLTMPFPASFTLVDATADVTLSDQGGAREVTFHRAWMGDLTFRAGTCDPAGLTCSYSFDRGSVDPGDFLDLDIRPDERAKLDTALEILKLEGVNTPNTVAATFTITVESDPGMSGYTLELTLKSADASVKLGG